MAAVLLTGAPMLWSACTDTWNEHYEAVAGGMADQPSLWETISSDPSLRNLTKVIESIDAKDLLDSPQQFTVWAPKSLTEAQADSIIEVYKADKNAGLKWEDNKAITQFLQNHMALYARPVSEHTEDTVAMRNNKYMFMKGANATSGTLAGNAFGDMALCNNGILYKTNDVLQFFPNVREYTELHPNMSKLTAFLKHWDEYELDIAASTPGGIVDGKTVYLDSVVTRYNDFLSSYGYIQREDSVYTFLAPTDEVWDREYEKYSKYFNYNKGVSDAIRDSLTDVHTAICILNGRFFNTSKNWRYNLHPEDSLCNTNYYEHQEHNPRLDVYYKPQEGILKGLDKAVCSNGAVYVDNKGAIDPRSTFFSRTDLECSTAYYYEIPKDKNNNPTMNVQNRDVTFVNYDYDYVYDEEGNVIDYVETGNRTEKRYKWIEVSAKTASEQSMLEFKIPSTYSNVYYNVYVVSMPDLYSQNQLPTWFQVSQSVQNDKGVFGSKSYLNNPNPITADSEYDNLDQLLKQSNLSRGFVTNPYAIDTILVQKALKFDYSGVGVDGGVVKLNIESWGGSSSSIREKIYTRTLRLNEIILVPFETKEEAEAAADDLDAFNDAVLQALKEN